MAINPASLVSDDALKQFLSGELLIDCIDVKLVQRDVDLPRTFVCQGVMVVSPAAGIRLRLIVPNVGPNRYDPIDGVFEQQEVRPGQIIPDHFYYRLEATDFFGNLWASPSVQVRFEQNTEEHLVVQVQCGFIEAKRPYAGLDHVRSVFQETLKFPVNQMSHTKFLVRGMTGERVAGAGWEGEVAGMKVTHHRCVADPKDIASELTAVWPPGQQAGEGFEQALLEAVRFCVAQLVWPIWTEVAVAGTCTVRLSKARPVSKGELLLPPLNVDRDQGDFRVLMDAYCRYALSSVEDGSRLSERLGGLYTLGGVWLDTVALLLCVTAEGILNAPMFKPLGAPGEVELKAVDALLAHVGEAAVPQALLSRAAGALGSMRSSRAVDRMHVLVNTKAIDEEEVRAWKAIRNSSAHGSFKLEEDQFQEALDRINRIVTLIYRLSFLVIGYRGRFTNFGAFNWPTQQYDAVTLRAELGLERSA